MNKACTIGRKDLRLAATALASTYDSTSIPEFLVHNSNTVTLHIDLTLQTATSVELQVDVATPDNGPGAIMEPAPVSGDWFPLTSKNVSGLTVAAPIITLPMGQATLSFAATGKYAVVLTDICEKYLRVRAKTTGAPGSSTFSVVGISGLS